MKNYKSIQEVRDCNELSEIEKVQIEYAEGLYYLSGALESYETVEVFEGSAIDYATDLINKLYVFGDSVAKNIDYEAFSKDLITRGDISEFNHKYLIVNIDYI